MKHTTKRAAALLLLLSLVLSLFTVSVSAAGKITTAPTGYTKASDVQYKEVGGHLANWGARGEDCVFLTTYAGDYYTGNSSFDKLNAPEGGTSQSNAPQSALYSTLQEMMKSHHSHQTNYGETRDLYQYTDCVSNDTAHISSFYSGKQLGGKWDSGKTWNREHTWPNSKGLDGNDENDIMMLRPTYVKENSSRGNTAYGNNYFDPGVSTRGDCARIVLYVYVRWGNTGKMWGASGVMENLDVLLQWMEEDPVDTWEMGRNDAVQDITGVRNVFVDFPEFAWKLFGRQVPKNMTTPSGYAKDGTIHVPDGKPTPPVNPDVPETDYNKPGTPVAKLPENGEYVIWAPAHNKAMSSVWPENSYYNTGKDVAVADGKLTGYGDTEKWTIQDNGDGTVSILVGGKKLGMQDQYTSMSLGARNDKWVLEDAGNGLFYVKNSVCNAYIQWFAAKETWSAYNKIDAGKESCFALALTSTKDSTVPVEPEQPTEPDVKPTDPEVKPTDPEVKPTDPEVKPTDPEVKPTDPEVKPTEPEVKPTIPKKNVLSMKIPGKTVYFNGKIANKRFLGTTTNVAEAVEVFKEETDGGFYLYFMDGSAKKYISVQETEYKDKKTGEMKKGNQIALTDKAESVYHVDSKLGTLVTSIGKNQYYLGSYTNKDGKTFDTISASKTKYVNAENIGKTQFAAKLTAIGGGSAQTGDSFSMVTVVTAMVGVSALAVLVINRKKYHI